MDLKSEKEKRYYYNDQYKSKFNKEKIQQEKLYQIMYQTILNDEYDLREYLHCPSLNMKYIPIIKDDFGVRKLTPSECFAFQGYFDVKIPQGINDRLLYKYATQCSSVADIERIVENIIKVLNNDNEFSEECKNVIFDYDEKINTCNVVKSNNIELVKSSLDLNLNKKAYINESSLSSLLKKVEQSEDKIKKAKVLEILMKLFFEQVDGFHVDTNVKTKTEEIDINIRNESKSEFWKKESIFFLGECKNWTEKCGKNELVVFRSKIENRRDRVKLGFFISWNEFTETYTYEDLRGSKEDILIIPITGQQIKEYIVKGEIETFLKDWYRKAVIV